MKFKNSYSMRRIQKLAANRLAVVGFSVLVLMMLVCIAAPVLTPYDPSALNPADKFLPMSAEHLLGTDQLGRDLLARILYGGRVSIFLGLSAALLTNLLGVALGCISGYYGGKVDAVLLYIGEVLSCFPGTILILLVISFLGQSIGWLITVWTFTGWVGTMRMVRSRMFSLKEEPYIDSCRVNGVSSWSIMFRHLLPNTVGVITVNITMNIAGYVLAEAGLSYLGFGVPASIPTWGNMMNAAKNISVMINNPNLWIIPGAAISLFVLACNFFGDGLRDVLDVTQ